ncbi:MAG: hypothetical protein ACP5JJ_17915, partial [Anaerolineae bacterium]
MRGRHWLNHRPNPVRRARIRLGALALIALLLISSGAQAQGPAPQATLGTAFTYQGRLNDASGPVTDTCDFTFKIYDEAGSGTPPTGGTLLGTETKNSVQVSDGYFREELDFGSGVFNGDARYLEITVDCGSGPMTLSPRQPLTPTPYALYATSAPWSGLDNVPAGFADDVDNVGWALTGNSGTTPGTHFLGTTDDQPLELHVNGARILCLEPDGTSPNLIGGHSSNTTSDDPFGVTIGGGGSATSPNSVTDIFGTIAGGAGNVAGDDDGNRGNIQYATVGGGFQNEAVGAYSIVGGGRQNQIGSSYAAIAGGRENNAAGQYTTIGGGYDNTVTRTYATIG